MISDPSVRIAEQIPEGWTETSSVEKEKRNLQPLGQKPPLH